MACVDTIADILLQFQTYVVYQKFNIDTATWLNFNEMLWAQLPHHTFATVLSSATGSLFQALSQSLLVIFSKLSQPLPNI